jgi:prevent-host-death family protein
MKTLTITAARRRFGAMLDFATCEPVLITRKSGKGAAVIMSAEAYSRMTGIASFERRRARETRKTASSRTSR